MADRERVEELFHAALGVPEGEREAFVRREAGGDEGLAREALSLLAHDSDSTVEALRGVGAGGAIGERPGDEIGPYTLVERIGEGGFGTVYKARQRAPVERDVALKVIKLGMDTRRVAARFEAERQALASMEHPHVARVFDAGATAEGRPYFAMELVGGEPITRWCDASRLGVDERLRAFGQVCDAVRHAHQKGLIHRDLKPGNALVEEVDGRPFVKVIDFGIAKALDSGERGAMTVTEQGSPIGTPAYMSPEQAQGRWDLVDTRTDVYALGVMLFELLTGRLPFDDHAARTGAEPAPRPSTRAGSSTREAARARGTEPGALARRLRGDLDWITLKAMAEEPERRYAGVGELEADLERHLRSLPVLAGPPGAAYRARKFVRRNRAGVAAAGVLLAAVVVGGAGLATGLVRARAEAARATREAATSEQVTALLTDLLEGVDPQVAQGRDTAVLSQVLDEASERVGEELADQPAARARLRHTIGATRSGLGQYEAAARELRKAHETRRRLAPGAARTQSSATLLANAMTEQDRYEEALSVIEASMAAHTGETAEDRVARAGAWHALASALRESGRMREAREPMERAAEVMATARGPEHNDVLAIRHDLAWLMSHLGEYAAAEAELREVMEVRERTLGPDHPHTLHAVSGLAYALGSQGEMEAAEPHYRRALEGRRRVLGPEHPETLDSLNNVAFLCARTGRLEEAQSMFEELVATYERLRGRRDARTYSAMHNLGAVMQMRGDLGAADRVLTETYEGRRELLGAGDLGTLYSAHKLAGLRREHGRLEAAVALYRSALEGRREALGAGHPLTLDSGAALVEALAASGERARAGERAASIRSSVAGEDLPRASERALGRLREAVPQGSASGERSEAGD